MLRKSSLLAAVVALVLCVPVAHAAGWTVGVNGGLAKPTGDEGKDSKIGPIAGIDICMHITDNIAVGAEGNWSQNKHKDVGVTEQDFPGPGDTYTLDKATFKILSGGIHGKYMFPVSESPISPYVLLGLGMYSLKDDFQETYVFASDPSNPVVVTDESAGVESETRFGGKIGAGAVYKATEKVGISLAAEYNLVTLDTQGVPQAPSNFKFFSIRAGVNFHIMPSQ